MKPDICVEECAHLGIAITLDNLELVYQDQRKLEDVVWRWVPIFTDMADHIQESQFLFFILVLVYVNQCKHEEPLSMDQERFKRSELFMGMIGTFRDSIITQQQLSVSA